MFRRLPGGDGRRITVSVEGRPTTMPAGQSVAAALFAAGLAACRTTPASGRPRGPFCMMGVCFDCLVVVDGMANRQACMTEATEGMRITRQRGSEGAWAEGMGM